MSEPQPIPFDQDKQTETAKTPTSDLISTRDTVEESKAKTNNLTKLENWLVQKSREQKAKEMAQKARREIKMQALTQDRRKKGRTKVNRKAVIDEHTPDVYTIGKHAVESSINNAYRMTEQELKWDGEIDKTTSMYLGTARNRLRDIPQDKVKAINAVLDYNHLPEWLRHNIGMSGADINSTPLEAITRQNEDGSFALSDETFLNILQWHNYMLSHLQKKYEHELWPAIKDEYLKKLQDAVHAGWLPHSALSEKKKERILSAKVELTDGLRLILDDTFATASHIGPNEPDVVTIQPGLENSTFFHELTHVSEGADEKLFTSISKIQAWRRNQHGLNRLFARRSLAGNVINEAVTEHINQTLKYGDVNTIDPRDKPGAYVDARHLLDTICRFGEHPIDIQLFIEAYFEDTPKKRHREKSAMAELKRQLKTAFPGRDILADLDDVLKGRNEIDWDKVADFEEELLENTLDRTSV